MVGAMSAMQELLTQLWVTAVLRPRALRRWHEPALIQGFGRRSADVALDTAFNRRVLQTDDQLTRKIPGELATRLKRTLRGYDARRRARDHGQQLVRDRYSWA